MIVTIEDVAGACFCRKGTRAFFAKYNLDYSDFLKNGIDEERFTELNDSMADKVVRFAHGRK